MAWTKNRGGPEVKGCIDRIEDGKTAVVIVDNYGQLRIPVKTFGFEIHEGQHLRIDFSPDPKAEAQTLSAVKALQQNLLKRPRK
jgi:hypothetical protein